MAGEIQLNSTTMATESSGSITAQLDTIRPNTTNGSLTLQGDSSDAGVTGLTIDSSGNATFAQTITGGTIGSGVVFPAGNVIQVEYDNDDTAQNTTASFVDYLQINITPKKSGNLIFITATIATHHISAGTTIAAKLVRDSTDLNYEISDYYNSSGGSVPGNISFTFIDNPTIPSTPVSINYKIQIKHEAGSGSTNKDYSATLNGVSSLVAMEIQQ